jgi:hypothetical protein
MCFTRTMTHVIVFYDLVYLSRTIPT